MLSTGTRVLEDRNTASVRFRCSPPAGAGSRGSLSGALDPAAWAVADGSHLEVEALEVMDLLAAALSSGLAASRAAERNRPFAATAPQSDDGRAEVAALTVATALNDMRAALSDHKLVVLEGCFRSLLIDMCWWRISRELHRWAQQETAGTCRAAHLRALETTPVCHPDVADSVATNDLINRLLGTMEVVDCTAVLMSAAGWTQREIGEVLQVGQQAVAKRLGRIRREVRRTGL
jgi:hypothetical protein